MPDAAATNTKAAPDGEHKNPPDLVGEELADSAKIWRVYERVAKEDDERRTKEWDSGLNNLALFAGLFSAVTTAFIIEARQDMEPDYAQLTFLVLNATAFGEKPVHQPFVIPSSARTVNCLWVASLILSLSAALIAIMGKDWIGMYTARPVCNLRQWAEMRTYRLICVERWYMSGVIAAAPVLLHVSLVLFGAGLVLFISSDPFTHRLTLGLSLAAGVLYLVTTLSAIVFSTSPFKSPATQMIRGAFSGSFSYVRSVTTRPKRGLVDTLLRDMNMMVVGYEDESDFARASVADANGRRPQRLVPNWTRPIYLPGRSAVASLLRNINTLVMAYVDDFPLLPSSTPTSVASVQWLPLALRAASRSVQWSRVQSQLHSVSSTPTSVASVQWLPLPLRAAWRSVQWSRVQSQLHSVASWVYLIPFSDWVLSSMWTGLPTDPRPQLLADALSWLNAASQAPDVFRAIIFALGDPDVGPQVGKHVTTALHTRLRSEIRRTWRQVDFLMLSRYVLADRNTPGEPVLGYRQFAGRFDMWKDSSLRCEDGLAAVIRVYPHNIDPDDLVQYSPDHVAQPRMHEFLLPHVRKPQRNLTGVLILLSNRYRKHLLTTDSFSLSNLEAHLYQTLDNETRDAYATAITVKYGGTPGAIELLTFLCCHGVIDDDTIPAAVELVMELLEHEPNMIIEHRCLAYLFGSSDLWDATWNNKHWSFFSLDGLSRSLLTSCFQPCEPSSVRTLSDDCQFDLALARTAAMMLSPEGRRSFAFGWAWIEFLHDRLCQTPLPSQTDNDETADVIRLILESGALIEIMGMPDDYDYRDDVVNWATAILAAIISHVGHCLCDPATIHDGEQLFAALARTAVWDFGPRIWDLGEWLRTRAPAILKKRPPPAAAMRDVCEALTAIYPLCKHNPNLRASWDRIGYSGPPAEIIYLCDPYLDIGEFFARAEDPLSQSGV